MKKKEKIKRLEEVAYLVRAAGYAVGTEQREYLVTAFEKAEEYFDILKDKEEE